VAHVREIGFAASGPWHPAASEATLGCECSDIVKVMTMGLEAFGGSPGVLERLIRREDLSW
jgi:hypothetical protein